MYHPTLGVMNLLVSLLGLSYSSGPTAAPRPVRHRPGGRLGVDASHQAHRDWRGWRPCRRSRTSRLRSGGHAVPMLLSDHPAAAPPTLVVAILFRAIGRVEDLRHHLRHDPRGPLERLGDHQHPVVQSGVLVLQHGLCLLDGGGPVRHRHGSIADPHEVGGWMVSPKTKKLLMKAAFYAAVIVVMLPHGVRFLLDGHPCPETTSRRHSLSAQFLLVSVTFKGTWTSSPKNPFLPLYWNSLVVWRPLHAPGSHHWPPLRIIALPTGARVAWPLVVLAARIIPGSAT